MLALWLAVQKPTFDFQVEQGKGLVIRALGVPIVRGSSFQYYPEGWAKGYYSFSYGSQHISRPDGETVRVDFSSPSGALGDVTYHRNGSKLDVHYDLKWNGDIPAHIELAAGLIWAPALEAGQLTSSGKPMRALNTFSYSGSEIGARRFGPDSSSFDFDAPLAAVQVRSSVPLTLFDARGGYKQDWAKESPTWWLGSLDLPVAKEQPVSLDVQWSVEPKPMSPVAPLVRTLTKNAVPDALVPDTAIPPLIPRPKSNQLDWNVPVELANAFTFPTGLFDDFGVFEAALKRRFVMPTSKSQGRKLSFDAGISQLGFTPGGYKIFITSKSITVLGEEEEGLRDGLERLAALAFCSKGRLWLPTGTLIDQPRTEWRGVHLFVGPQANPFQRDLWSKVLRPLGFNKVVLQCERTAWDTLPGIASSETMSKPDLLRLFQMYRTMGVEPIPLIQSYGHMEWLFHNGKNLSLAMNPKEPYAVDPRKAETREVLTKLWDEAIGYLKPQTVHFGLDEVDMTGVAEDPPLETSLWQSQLTFLGELAGSHKVKMMLWGDQGLAPGEGPDATNGDTKGDAAARRAAIPKGSLIGDWHYVADPEPSAYARNIDIWKSAGMQPIASTWFDPQNIAGFYGAAGAERIGTLQTTWSGYESSEEALLGNFKQYSAFILAADYSWSGRTDRIETLDYDPAQVFRRMYFQEPSLLVPLSGTALGELGKGFQVGLVKYGRTLDLNLSSILRTADPSNSGSTVALSINGKGSKLAIAMSTLVAAPDETPVAELEITLGSGKVIRKELIYGRQVRATDDKAPMPLSDRNQEGLCSYVVQLGSTGETVKTVSLKPMNAYTGLRIWGLELIN